jgi:flagellar basal-body rod protein FlgF
MTPAPVRERTRKDLQAMENSLLVSLSQQLAAYRSMDVIANNIANVSTPGFRREEQTFQEYVAHLAPPEGQAGIQDVSFVQEGGIVRDMSQGPRQATGAPLDLAIEGDGYFVVKTPAGDRYTRNGHFTLDADGQIVDDAGDAVQGDGGTISISTDDGDIHFGPDGTISGKNGQIGKIRIVTFAHETALAKQGANLYAAAEQPTAAAGFTLTQGMLEASNVQPVVEISRMIDVMRAYQATATLTESQENLLRQAIDKLGQTPQS